MRRAASVVQAVGLVSLTVAGFLAHVVVGFAVLGVGLVLWGLAMERT